MKLRRRHFLQQLGWGAVTLRVGRTIDWDGEKLRIPGASDAAAFVQAEDRKQWL